MNRKAKHNLHLCKNASDLINGLADLEIDIEAVVIKHLKPGTSFSIIAAGSITQDCGNSESDVDLLVLFESESDFIRSSADVNLEYGSSIEVLLYQNGIEINIDFMARDRLQGVINSFLSIAPALYNPQDVKSLILVGWEDLQFLDRLKNGWEIRPYTNVDTLSISHL
jgi:predicted nucleotidyltransferase